MYKQEIIEELLTKGIYKLGNKQLWQLSIEELQKLLREVQNLEG